MSDKPTERAPLLSDSQRGFIISKHVWKDDKFGKALKVADEIRAFYEAKITSGELLTKEEHDRLLKEAEDRASFRWSE